jgi:hypothetical protein
MNDSSRSVGAERPEPCVAPAEHWHSLDKKFSDQQPSLFTGIPEAYVQKQHSVPARGHLTAAGKSRKVQQENTV